MTKPTTDGGYELPEVIDPERVCIQLYVPNETNHLRAFWGAIHELCYWYTWQRDDAHTGRLVAAVWRDVYYDARTRNLVPGEGCEPVTDPCCPEEIEILKDIRKFVSGGWMLVPAAAAQPPATLPECAPEFFGGNPGDLPDVFTFRQRALCYTLRNMFVDAVIAQFTRLALKGSVLAKVRSALGGVATAQTSLWSYVDSTFLKSADAGELIDDQAAFNAIVCYVFNKWFGLRLTYEDFAAGLDGFVHVDPPANLVDRLFLVLHDFLTFSKNFTLFGEALDTSFAEVQQNEDIGNNCDCGIPMPCGVVTGTVVANFGGHYPPCPVQALGENKFRFSSVVAPDGFPDIWLVYFKTDGGLCATATAIAFTYETPDQTTLRDRAKVLCDDFSSNDFISIGDCFKDTYISFSGNGSPGASGRFYVDVTFSADCCT